MSNIVLKGDVVQNLGEYLPNVYIESVRVSDRSTTQISLTIDYSILFLIDDEYDINDITQNLQDINIMFAFARSSDIFKKQQVVDAIVDETIGERGEKARESYSFNIDQIDMDSIFDSIGDGNYIDDLYDDQDRRILKITTGYTKFLSKTTYDSNNLYCYAFTSIAPLSSLESSAKDVVYLNTSNIAYEKILSPGLNVLRDEELIYLDSQGEKYGQTPILGLNRRFYKTTTVTREFITSKVNALVERFNSASEGPLSDSVSSIKYVLRTEADTERLLVELDKVRRSFPNKTNNNPVGNLYAAYARLLQNINSAFLPSEIVTKEKYLTGKVFDLRTGLTRGYEPPEPTDSPSYIPSDMFFVHRERKSADAVEDDLGINRGMFFIRYEEMLKRMSNIGKLIDINKLYETVSDQDLDDLKRILFSYFRIYSIYITKFHKEQRQQTSYILYGNTRINRNAERSGFATPIIDSGGNAFAGPAPPSPDAQILREYNYGFESPSERMLCYQFQDLDKFSAIYEENEIELNGGMNFEYTVGASIYDDTNEFITYLISKFDDIKNSLDDYTNLAKEICSYNNIDNRFNDFFVNSIREQFPSGIYPWESAPAIYAVMAYVLTTNFETFEDAIRYSKNVTATISPENGSLESLVDFGTRLDNLRTQQIAALEDANDEPSGIRGAVLEKEVALKPLNYVQLLSEADAEFESLIAGSPITVASVDGVTRNGMLEFGDGNLSSYDTATDFYIKLMELLKITLNNMVDKDETVAIANAYPEIAVSSDSFQTFLNINTYFLRQTEQEILKPLGVFVDALNTYFREKRNLSLRQNGLNYPFDYGVNDRNSVESSTDMREIVATFLNSMNQNFIANWDGLFATFDETLDNTINILVRDILNYYRLNTDKLMIDLSKAGFAFATATDPSNELKQKINSTIITEATNMASFDEYTGPELNEIPGYEDIVVRDN